MNFLKVYLLIFIFSSFFSFTEEAEKIVGVWFTEGKTSKIQIYKVEKEYFGKIIWIASNGKKEDLKVKPTIGYQIFRKFTYENKNQWTGGQVSDPRSGMTVSGRMTLKDEKTLSVRGYVGSPMFGKTVILTRAE